MVAVTGSLQKRRADRRRNSKPGLLVWGPTESFAEGTPPWAGVPSDDSGFYATVTKTNDALRVRRHRPFVRDDDQRMPLAMKLVEQRQNFLTRCRVEIARGLVGQND